MSKSLDLSRIVIDRLSSKNDYFPEVHPKRQLYIYHSETHPDPAKVIQSWRKGHSRTAASLVIAGKPYEFEKYYQDGDIFSAFPSKYWAMHLKIHQGKNEVPARYKSKEHTRFLEKYSIAIVLCNAGALSWENGRFFSSFRTVIPDDQVIEYVEGYRGKRFFHKYTPAQIESLRQLLVYLCTNFEIPMGYQPDMWNISEDALLGKKGIYTLASVRTDRLLLHPQPDLVQMLMDLYKNQEAPSGSVTSVKKPSSAQKENKSAPKEEKPDGQRAEGEEGEKTSQAEESKP